MTPEEPPIGLFVISDAGTLVIRLHRKVEDPLSQAKGFSEVS